MGRIMHLLQHLKDLVSSLARGGAVMVSTITALNSLKIAFFIKM